MNPKEIAIVWKEIVRIFSETKNISPKITMNKIIDTFGISQTKEVFATVAAIKKHDGRIYGDNRKYMNSISVQFENTEWKRENPIIYAGLDDIHTTHINQLITELRKLDK